jgi:hypothetical protein
VDVEPNLGAKKLDFFHAELDGDLLAVLEMPEERTAVDPDSSATHTHTPHNTKRR